MVAAAAAAVGMPRRATADSRSSLGPRFGRSGILRVTLETDTGFLRGLSACTNRDGPVARRRIRCAGPTGLRTWYAATADRIGAIFLGLAVTATAGALAMAGTAAAAPVAAPAATTAASTPAASDREQGVSRANIRAQLAVEDVMSAAAATRTASDPVLKPTRTMFARTS